MNPDIFILNYLKRTQSLFFNDLQENRLKLQESITNKKVLVVGGAGTIGYSFIKALLKYKPGKLVIVDLNENGLTELVRDLRSMHDQFVPQEFYTYPVSFGSAVFKKLFVAHGPFDIVANFAAHKHVRSEKDIFSIEALLETNIIKAKGLLDLLVTYPPQHFFCVSTDKAANPVNILGASKKIMEDLIFSYSAFFKVSTARFANVAFSNGSLLEGFLKRIDKQQPLACPIDIRRFFVSPEESGQICLLACILANSGEIFFPKLYERDMVNFADLVTPILAEFGYEAVVCDSEHEAKNSMYLIKEKKFPVYLFKTDTSGEKLYEEFYTDAEVYDLGRFKSLCVISNLPTYSVAAFDTIINELQQVLSNENITKEGIVGWLKKYVPEFNHVETGLGLDRKM